MLRILSIPDIAVSNVAKIGLATPPLNAELLRRINEFPAFTEPATQPPAIAARVH